MKKIGMLIAIIALLALPLAGQMRVGQGPPISCGPGANYMYLDSPNNITYSCGGLGTVPIPNDAWFSVLSSTTAQATANVSTDQNLISSTMGMPYSEWVMNQPGRLLEYAGFGTYNLGTTSTVTVKLKLCTIAGCGSGTVITLASWTTASQTNTSVTLGFNVNAYCVTVTSGATGTLECHGTLNFDSGATLAAASTTFNDSNTAVISSVPLNGQWFLQSTLAFNSANASNTATLRIQSADVWGPGVIN